MSTWPDTQRSGSEERAVTQIARRPDLSAYSALALALRLDGRRVLPIWLSCYRTLQADAVAVFPRREKVPDGEEPTWIDCDDWQALEEWVADARARWG